MTYIPLGAGGGGGGVGTLGTITLKITGTKPAAADPVNINTGVFVTAGAQTVVETGGTLLLPATGPLFDDNGFIKVFRNGVWQVKGPSAAADTLVYWLSTTTLAFTFKLQKNDVIHIQTPETY